MHKLFSSSLIDNIVIIMSLFARRCALRLRSAALRHRSERWLLSERVSVSFSRLVRECVSSITVENISHRSRSSICHIILRIIVIAVVIIFYFIAPFNVCAITVVLIYVYTTTTSSKRPIASKLYIIMRNIESGCTEKRIEIK